MKKIISIIIVILMFFSGSLVAFPGDHESYSCEGWRSTSCEYNSDGTVKYPNYIDPGNPSKGTFINNTCGNDSVYNLNPIHDQESHFSMFGDSLTELVDAYGIFGFNAYFHALGYPVNSQNFGQVGLTSQGLRKSTGAIPGGSKIRRCEPFNYHPTGHGYPIPPRPKTKAKSSSRSVIMIGGNDIQWSTIGMVLFPFLKSYYMEHVTNNIRHVVDWNLENGKLVLLLGTIPPNSVGLREYDTFYVNRRTLCNGITSPIPENLPAWVVLLIPGLADGVIEYYENGIQAFMDFLDMMMTDSFKGLFINASITQACLNDKLYSEVLPAYHMVPNYRNRIHMLPMYDFFAENHSRLYGGSVDYGNILTTKNFWVPSRVAYLQAEDFSKSSVNDLTEVYKSPEPEKEFPTIFDFFDSIDSQLTFLVEHSVTIGDILQQAGIPTPDILDYFFNHPFPINAMQDALGGVRDVFDFVFHGKFFGIEYSESNYNPYLPRKGVLDPIHVGPIGYLHWTNIMKSYFQNSSDPLWNSWMTNINHTGLNPVDGEEILIINNKIREKAHKLEALFPTEPGIEYNSKAGSTGRCQTWYGPDPEWLGVVGAYWNIDLTICYISGPVPAAQAFMVYGPLREFYRSKGGPSWIGFPVGDEHLDGTFGWERKANFECGSITWMPVAGITEISNNGSCPGFKK